jgi:hypothetical protein
LSKALRERGVPAAAFQPLEVGESLTM